MLEINPGLLAAQVVTFLLGIAILWFVAWKPLVARMMTRREDLARQLKEIELKAQEIENLKVSYERELAHMGAKTESVMKEAHQKAQEVVSDAQAAAQATFERCQRQMEQEKQRLIIELRGEFSDMVTLGVERVLRRRVDAQVEENLYDDMLKELSQIKQQ